MEAVSERILGLRRWLGKPSPSSWYRLWLEVESWGEFSMDSLEGEYLNAYLSQWPDELRELPSDLLGPCALEGYTSPMLAFVRSCWLFDYMLHGVSPEAFLSAPFLSHVSLLTLERIALTHEFSELLRKRIGRGALPMLRAVRFVRPRQSFSLWEALKEWRLQRALRDKVQLSILDEAPASPKLSPSVTKAPKPYRFVAAGGSLRGNRTHIESVGMCWEHDRLAFVYGTGDGIFPCHLGQTVCAALLGQSEPAPPESAEESKGCTFFPEVVDGAVWQEARVLLGRGMSPLGLEKGEAAGRFFSWLDKSICLYLKSTNDEEHLWLSGWSSIIFTTGLLASWQEQNLQIWYIGDCRVLRWREGKLLPLSLDHNVRNALSADQLDSLTTQQLEASPLANMLTRSLGDGKSAPGFVSESSLPGDLYLFCGRTFHRNVSPEQLVSILSNTHNVQTDEQLQALCQELVDAAEVEETQAEPTLALVYWEG